MQMAHTQNLMHGERWPLAMCRNQRAGSHAHVQ